MGMKHIPNTPGASIRISFQNLQIILSDILRHQGFPQKEAELCAKIFAENSLDGVYTHGVDRFMRFIEYIQRGHIKIHARPKKVHQWGAVEQWDGCLGPGILNSVQCTDRAMKISKKYGIGCVALRNTNHWMRGGTYAWRAAKEGFLFIGWSNTIANMPAWGAVDCHLGNNPLVLGVPFKKEAVVLDMAVSQFSFGTMERLKRQGKKLNVPGGYDFKGNLSIDPGEILKSKRVLPIGYWKGSGMALLLDIIGCLLSGGLSTQEISKQRIERGLSQVFIAFDSTKISNGSSIGSIVGHIITDFKNSRLMPGLKTLRYPGERTLQTRNENLKKGISIEKEVWEEIQNMHAGLSR